MNEVHPSVQETLDMARELRNRIADLRERIEGIHGDEPSPQGHVVAKVDAMGRLTGLRLCNNATTQLTGVELAREVLASIRDSGAAAEKQYEELMAGEMLLGDLDIPGDDLPGGADAGRPT